MDVVQNMIGILKPTQEPASPCESELSFTEELHVGREIVEHIIESSDSEESKGIDQSESNYYRKLFGLNPIEHLTKGLKLESIEELTPQL